MLLRCTHRKLLKLNTSQSGTFGTEVTKAEDEPERAQKEPQRGKRRSRARAKRHDKRQETFDFDV